MRQSIPTRNCKRNRFNLLEKYLSVNPTTSFPGKSPMRAKSTALIKTSPLSSVTLKARVKDVITTTIHCSIITKVFFKFFTFIKSKKPRLFSCLKSTHCPTLLNIEAIFCCCSSERDLHSNVQFSIIHLRLRQTYY